MLPCSVGKRSVTQPQQVIHVRCRQALDGVRGTHSQLLETLAREGFQPIEAAGHPFDPAVHEAVAGPPEQGEGDLMVASELRRGYVMRGRVIRPSLVMVEHA